MSVETIGIPQPILQIEGLTKRYAGSSVLHDLSLAVQSGEFIAILGSSGSGKSTLLRLLAGLEPIDAGSIKFDGQDQSKIPPHQRDVAIVFQHGNGYGHLTVDENLSLALKTNRTRNKDSHEKDRWIDGLGIRALLDRPLNQLSGGQLQRVAIARAYLTGKSTILMDEPLAHLDRALRSEVRSLLLRIHAEHHKTVIYVTHDSEEAMFLANRIAVLGEGRILQVGKPRELYESPVDEYVAKLVGQPTISFVRLPSTLLTSNASAQDSALCGIRPNDWQVLSVDHRSVEATDNNALEKTNPITPGTLDGVWGIELEAEIVKCRWLGDRWFILAQCPQSKFPGEQLEPTAVEISCPSAWGGPLEKTWKRVESGESSESERWFVRAFLPGACIKTLRNTP